jgi:hypothetical protein
VKPEKSIVESNVPIASVAVQPIADWHPGSGDQRFKPMISSTSANPEVPKKKTRKRRKKQAIEIVPKVKTHTRSSDPGMYFSKVRKIRQKKRENRGRRIGKKHKLELKDLSSIEVRHLSDPRIKLLLGVLDSELKRNHLLSDEAQEVAFSEIFPLSQSKIDSKTNFDERAQDIETMVASITNEGNELGELVPGPLPNLPVLSTPQIHNLMRRNPANIYEKIARLMVETHYFDNQSSKLNLLPCAYLFSKAVESLEIFCFIKLSLSRRGLKQYLKSPFPFSTYKAEQPTLKLLIDEALKNFFCTPWVLNATKRYLKEKGPYSEESLKQSLDSFWERFTATWDSLTTKQKNACELVYLNEEPLTYKQAAEQLQISVDSLQDRLTGAVTKFKDTFPELLSLDETLTYRKIHKENNLQRALFDQNKANEIPKLFRVDLATGEKTEIPPREGPLSQSKHLEDPYWFIDEIKAFVIAEVPVPDILDAEYFGDLYPERYHARMSGEATFKGHGKRHQKMLTKIQSGERW